MFYNILAITERQIGFGNWIVLCAFFWPNLVVEFGLYLFLYSVRNKAKKKKRSQENKTHGQKYCCNSLKTVGNEVAMKACKMTWKAEKGDWAMTNHVSSVTLVCETFLVK